MKLRTWLYIHLLILFPIAAITAEKPKREPKYFAGGNFLYTQRIGSYVFEDLQMRQDTVREDLLLGGFALGRRYHINSWLRFQLSLMFHFGHNFEETILNYIEKYGYTHVGCDLDLHYVFPRKKRFQPFLALGFGGNYLKVQQSTIFPDDIKQLSPSLQGGGGLEYKLTTMIAINWAYMFRFWRPVKYRDERVLVLEGKEYGETFFSHIVQVNLLFNLVN